MPARSEVAGACPERVAGAAAPHPPSTDSHAAGGRSTSTGSTPTGSTPGRPPLIEIFALTCTLACSSLGALGIVAWHAAWPRLLTWQPGYVALHYNTAILLLLAGASLAAALRGRRSLAAGLSLLVTVFAAAIAVNEVFSLQLGLNSALFPVTLAAPVIATTRVAPNTAVALLLAGLAIFFLTHALGGRSTSTGTTSTGTHSLCPAAAMGVVVTVIAATALFGYVFSFTGAYRWRQYTAMSIPAAVALALLGPGLLAAARLPLLRRGRPAPALFLTILAVALPTAALLLWQALDWQRDLSRSPGFLPEIVLLVSLLLSTLALLSLWLAQVARRRRQALEASQQSLLAERRRLHTVLDMLPAYVILLSPDYRVPFANKFFEERFGKSEGRRCYDYLFQRDSPCENCESYTVAKTRAYHHWQWLGPDGRNYDIHDFPFTDHDGSPLIMEVGLDVTEQKQSESRLRAGEQRYRSLAIATAQVVWNTDAQGLVRGPMPSWTEFTGQTTEQYQGWGWLDAVHPGDRQRTAQLWKNATATRSFYEIEYRMRRHDGQYRDMWVRGVPVLHDDGSVREWVGACTDVTQRKLAAEALRRSQQRMQLHVQRTPLAVIEWNTSFQVVEWNPGAEAMFGYSREEMLGRTARTLLPEAQWGPVEQVLRDLAANRGGLRSSNPNLTRDGRIIECEWYNTPLINEAGEVIGIASLAQDITERKRMQEALARERERFLSVLDHLPVMVCLLTPDYHTAFANRAFRQAFGESQGRHCYEYCYGQSKPCEFCQAYRAMETGRPHDWESTTPKGMRIHSFDFPFTDTDGAALILEMNLDVTEQRAAEEKLKQYAAELERSNAELQDFASIASHDLQEPLRKVLAFGDRLHEHCGPALDETGQDYLRRMQNAAGRMSQLIESLLQYSRVTSRAQPFERVDLAQLMFEVVGDLEQRIGETGAKLRWDVLPIVAADRTQMRQVLQNLLSNALKFQPPGQKPEIAVSARRLPPDARRGSGLTASEPGSPQSREPAAASCWEIGIHDNGIGFEQQYADRIFRPFQRLHGRQQYAGSGMGLAICRKIVQRHGGTLAVHSEPGAGSTFVITLPAHATERSQPCSADKSASSSSPKMTTTITCSPSRP